LRTALVLPRVAEIGSNGFDLQVGGKRFAWSYTQRWPAGRHSLRPERPDRSGDQ